MRAIFGALGQGPNGVTRLDVPRSANYDLWIPCHFGNLIISAVVGKLQPEKSGSAANNGFTAFNTCRSLAQVLPMLEEVCFLREDGQAPLLPHISDGKVDLREIAGLLQGSTERPLALQMHLGTWNLVSLKSDSRKLTLSHLRSITGREGTPSDPFLVRFLDGPHRRQGGNMPLPPIVLLHKSSEACNPKLLPAHTCASCGGQVSTLYVNRSQQQTKFRDSVHHAILAAKRAAGSTCLIVYLRAPKTCIRAFPGQIVFLLHLGDRVHNILSLMPGMTHTFLFAQRSLICRVLHPASCKVLKIKPCMIHTKDRSLWKVTAALLRRCYASTGAGGVRSARGSSRAAAAEAAAEPEQARGVPLRAARPSQQAASRC